MVQYVHYPILEALVRLRHVQLRFKVKEGHSGFQFMK